uniref:Protein CASP n=1 Tax=Ascaris suum TaxID=6253 RepID=F1KZE9_ASCSU
MAVPTIESVEAVAKSWSRVDWDNLQIRLNEEVKAIGSRQDDGDQGKRQLIEESAAFRENSDKAIRKAAVPLIKAFQAEVDRLTLRSKAAESTVIDLCRILIQIPDPSPYLEQLEPLLAKAKRLQSCEEEIAVVKSQLADLHLEYADLQNQELTVRKLREKVKHLELEAENNVQAALSNTEKQLRAEFDVYKEEMATKQDELSADNKKLVNTVADLEARNREIGRALDEAKSKLQQKETIQDEQLQIVSNDLENATHRAKEAEREVTRLREELAKFSNASNTISESNTSESALIRSKDNQIRKLLEENKNLSAKLAEVTTESRLRIDELTQELERHAEMLDRLETQLQAQSDYETIKKELRILKSVEFGEDASWTTDTDSGLTSSATATAEIQLGGRVKALEELLVDKSRRLQNDNVGLKMQNQQLSDRVEELEKSRQVLTNELEQEKTLVKQLESDLFTLHNTMPRSRADGADADELLDVTQECSTVEMLARELNVMDQEATKNVKSNLGNNVLSIMTAQRDRLRVRVEELELELSAQKQQNALLQSELDNAHQDNVKMYGKIKFLQSYQNKKLQPESINLNAAEAEVRYENEYEKHMDPFRKFNIQERQRKYAQLRPHDKAILGLGRWMMGSAQSRATFFFYLLFLHLLVFLVLYRYAYVESSEHDFQTDCVAKFQQHMHQFHANNDLDTHK